MSKVIWQSAITEEMVSELSEEDIAYLIKELNDTVEQTCSGYGL